MTEHSEQIVDELLVMECQDGSVPALEQLVSRWQKRLWRYAYRLTGDAEAAWDVTQESWLGVIRGLPRLSDPARFRPWVYRIVTRKADDWIAGKARARRRAARMREELALSREPDRAASDELQSLMDRLPGPSRTVLTLHYLEGLPIAEMAGILGIPPGTVKSRLHAARNELKALWQQASEEKDITMSDERIRQMIDDTYDRSREDTIRSMLSEFYSRKMAATAILVWGVGLLFLAAAVYSAVAFFGAAQTRQQIMYATIFISGLFVVGLMKIFAWQMLHRNSIKREIKRLELQVAQLAAALDKTT